MIALETASGLIVLLLAGDFLVRGSVALARRTRIPPVIIGLTVVAFGTSAPELFAAVGAVWSGHPEMSLGNVVGSNIANVLLVLGVPALILPTVRARDPLGTDAVWMMLVSALFVGLCFAGPIGPREGVMLLLLLVVMLLHSWWRVKRSGREVEAAEEVERIPGLPRHGGYIVAFLLGGAAGLPVGAYLLVDGGVQLAEALGVTERVIGLTVVALGTSLPELATTVMAAIRRHSDVAIGNVLGSNLFNILGIMGAVAVAAPAPVLASAAFLRFDLPVMLASAVGLGVLSFRGGAIGRRLGLLLVAAYLAYTASLFARPGL